jgi:hypothetical protein
MSLGGWGRGGGYCFLNLVVQDVGAPHLPSPGKSSDESPRYRDQTKDGEVSEVDPEGLGVPFPVHPPELLGLLPLHGPDVAR